MISLTVFALTIVGIYLLFYPAQSPLHELAMIYLPPIFIIRLVFIILSALYSPAAPHMRFAPQNCPSAATYFIGFMTFIIISLFATKTLLLLRSHGMSEGVFLLFYAHVGLFQFFILLGILWMDRARITRVIMKTPTGTEFQFSFSGSKIKRLWFLLAYVVWEICRTIIDRKLEEDRPQTGQELEDMEEGAEGSRKDTLLTLLRKVILVLIGVIVILTILNAVGINIGPLLAGAGILGLAVGFGSQTLVRDILSGVFFLMDDAFRVGDYIETAGTKGMVEHISMRSLRLRHPRGMVYTILFGDMGSVQNFSRDYIITKLDVRVRYDVDIEKIRKIVKKSNCIKASQRNLF